MNPYVSTLTKALVIAGSITLAGCSSQHDTTTPVTRDDSVNQSGPVAAIERKRAREIADRQAVNPDGAAVVRDINRESSVAEQQLRTTHNPLERRSPRAKTHSANPGQRIANAVSTSARESQIAPRHMPQPAPQPAYSSTVVENRENYQRFEDQPVKQVAQNPVSTFSIDVDTGSYSNVRRMISSGQMPPVDAVRVEEMLNYFRYEPLAEAPDDVPFAVSTELAKTPWNSETVLLRVGVNGKVVEQDGIPPVNLVFLVDVSGSMRSEGKLGLVKKSLRLLVNDLDERDTVSLVTYAGRSGVVLEPTPADRRQKILSAIDQLAAGGGTNGASGIKTAYALAHENLLDDGINRVLIATDGDFNVGTTGHADLMKLIETEREKGVSLTTLGFGSGNYNDYLMEQLADKGNGNHAYIDTLHEARKVLVEQRGATFHTIAKDVKIQIEFNPSIVSEYRLIGYENRALAREDFNNDSVDAGDIGAGHTVTALYELALVGEGGNRIDPLRYQKATASQPNNGELAFVKLRYKKPDETRSQLISQAVQSDKLDAMSRDMQFAAAVAGFGQLLRGSKYVGDFSFGDVEALATGSRGSDSQGHRSEFVKLVRLAGSIKG